MNPAPDNVTELLRIAGEGDSQAAKDLLRIVYEELRTMAKSCMANTPPGQTLQPTALVHEAFLRLVGRDQKGWENRAHFFFAASRAMRDILVENARAKGRIKRGGNRRRVDFDNLSVAVDAPGDDLLVLDDALTRMESEYPWEHRIVMLRFFAGMTNEETAQAIDAPLRTIERDWRFARAWLHGVMNGEDAEDGANPH
jgi:RNA polymerase sigma factor (TIGR02999 family)